VEPKRRLKFQLHWLERFKWLSYSKHLEGAFCKCCVLFGGTTAGKGSHQAVGALTCKPFTRWKDAIEVFEAHNQSEYHKTSIQTADTFMKVSEGEQADVIYQLDQDRAH
jgi:hypothetical protein